MTNLELFIQLAKAIDKSLVVLSRETIQFCKPIQRVRRSNCQLVLLEQQMRDEEPAVAYDIFEKWSIIKFLTPKVLKVDVTLHSGKKKIGVRGPFQRLSDSTEKGGVKENE